MSPNIKRWIIALIIIIVILSAAVFYYRNYYNVYQIDDWYTVIDDEGAKKITNSFLNNSSLTKYHVDSVTYKYRGRIEDSQVNLYDKYNNSIGWVLIHGNNAKIASININGIEIDGKNYSKITPGLWKKISTLDTSSYCRCILNLLQQFSEQDKNLLIKNQKFEIEFENSTAIIGVFPINKINNIINNDKIKNIDYVE